jgi:hypothetical protein
VNFPFKCSKIRAALAYGVYISQLIRYSRDCGSYQNFIDIGLLPTRKLLNQVIWSPPWLGWPLWNICVTNDHGYVSPVENTSWSFPRPWLITWFVTRLTRRVSLVEQEQLTPPEFTPGFQLGSCYSIFSFMYMFCGSLFVLLYFFFWPLCCLFFYDIRILITPLVSLNSA